MVYLQFVGNTKLFVNCLIGLKYLSSLEVLNLGFNGLMGGIPPIIGTLGSLKALSLGYNNLNDSFSMEGKWLGF